MGELREVADHEGKCTWHESEVRCNAPAVAGSARRAVCLPHLKQMRKLEMDPEAYAAWLVSIESQ